MSDTGVIVYCSDDRWCHARIKKQYRLKPLLCYRRGLSGNAPHRQLQHQSRLLIEFSAHAEIDLIAELGAVLLARRSPLATPIVIVIVAQCAAVTVDIPVAATPAAVTAAAPALAAAPAAAAPAAAPIGSVIGRIHYAAAAGRPSRPQYFDLIDTPPQFVVRDGVVAASVPSPASKPAAAAKPVAPASAAGLPPASPLVTGERAASNSDDPADGDDRSPRFPPPPILLPAHYAPLYRFAAHYLAPHQILTALVHAAAPAVAAAAPAVAAVAPELPAAPPVTAATPAAIATTPGSAAPTPAATTSLGLPAVGAAELPVAAALISVWRLAEHYLTVQCRLSADSSVQQETLAYCADRYRLSYFQLYQLRRRLQHHPALDRDTQQSIYRCTSYAEVSAVLQRRTALSL